MIRSFISCFFLLCFIKFSWAQQPFTKRINQLKESARQHSLQKNHELVIAKLNQISQLYAAESRDSSLHYANLSALKKDELLIYQKNIENDYLQKEIAVRKKNASLNQIVTLLSVLTAVLLIIILIVSNRKIIQQRRLNYALAEKNRAIAKQTTLISEQNAEFRNVSLFKDQLIAVISHDLRSPFATLLQLLDLIKEGDLTPEEIKMVHEDFYEKVVFSSRMLDNLLEWAAHSPTGLVAERSAVRLSELVKNCVSELEAMAGLKEIEMEVAVPEQSDLINVDPNQLTVILRNLLSNAIKFTYPKGIIALNYEVTSDQIKLNIKDNGIGIDEKRRANLFTVLGGMISSKGTAGEKGTGIGLALVANFAKLNGIKIKIETEKHKGTTFILHFDLYK